MKKDARKYRVNIGDLLWYWSVIPSSSSAHRLLLPVYRCVELVSNNINIRPSGITRTLCDERAIGGNAWLASGQKWIKCNDKPDRSWTESEESLFYPFWGYRESIDASIRSCLLILLGTLHPFTIKWYAKMNDAIYLEPRHGFDFRQSLIIV